MFSDEKMFSTLFTPRYFSTSPSSLGFINFKKINAGNKRWSKMHKKMQFKKWEKPGAFPDIPAEKFGSRSTGIRHPAFYEHIPEMIPELIVPDLQDCNLKPYVSYRTADIYQEELSSKDLFNIIYGRKIVEDFKSGKLDADGNSLEPSTVELLSPEQAEFLARQTGADLFTGGVPYSKTFAINYPVGKR
jgi:large subunit ribosomal protein L41